MSNVEASQQLEEVEEETVCGMDEGVVEPSFPHSLKQLDYEYNDDPSDEVLVMKNLPEYRNKVILDASRSILSYVLWYKMGQKNKETDEQHEMPHDVIPLRSKAAILRSPKATIRQVCVRYGVLNILKDFKCQKLLENVAAQMIDEAIEKNIHYGAGTHGVLMDPEGRIILSVFQKNYTFACIQVYVELL